MAGVKRERDEAVGVLTLDEPASLNAMTPVLGDLAAGIREMTDDPQVRALVLTAAAFVPARTSRRRKSSATTSLTV